MHSNFSRYLETNCTFEIESGAGPSVGESALKWVETTGADSSIAGFNFSPTIDLSNVWQSASVSNYWFRIEIKTDYSGELKVSFTDFLGKYQTIPITTQGTGLWENY